MLSLSPRPRRVRRPSSASSGPAVPPGPPGISVRSGASVRSGVRWVAALLGLFGVLASVSGCVTVHASDRVPAVDASEARQLVRTLDQTVTLAAAQRDPARNGTVEGGSIAAINQAGLKVLAFVDPQGQRQPAAYTHPDPQLLIPRLAGWPKWFAALSTPTYRDAKPTLLVFVRDSLDAPWRACWEPMVTDGPLPDLARDAKGYVQPVPVDDASLTVPPAQVAARLTGYLADGRTDKDLFAPGPYTTDLRQEHEKPVQQHFVRQVVDTPQPFPAVALRTRDGGALVLFAVEHSTRLTVQPPNALGDLQPSTMAFLDHKPTRSVTEHRLAEYLAVVPPTVRQSDRIRIVGTQSGLVGADGT